MGVELDVNDFSTTRLEKENTTLKEALRGLKTMLDGFADTAGEDVLTKSTIENGFYVERRKANGGSYFEPDYHGMVDFIIKEHKLISSEAYSYIYKNDYYQYIGRVGLSNIVTSIAKEKLQPAHLENFMKLLIAKSFNREKMLMSTDGLVNLANGILDVKKKTVEVNSPKYFFKYKLPHKYDSSAECPKFKQFLNFIFENNPDYVRAIAEIYGYCLLGGHQFLHKAFIFYGEGRNGKSTALDILEALLGKENVGNVSLGNLNKPFSVVNLDGKLANLVEETPNERINAEAFKTASSGGKLTAAHKGKAEYDVTCNCRMVCATNSMPNFSETSVGIKERLYFIKFNKFIAEHERDPHIKKYIIENEMSGVLNFALDGLADLLKRGFIMPTHGNSEVMNEFKVDSDSVYEFYDNRLVVDSSSQSIMQVKEIYESYKTYCISAGRHQVSLNSFSRRLRSIFKSEFTVDLKSRNDNRHGFRGVTFKSEM